MSANKFVKICSLIFSIILFIIFMVSIFVWNHIVITGFIGVAFGMFIGFATKDLAVDLIESQYKQKSSEEDKGE